jgi:hypothetical protein
MKQDLNVNIHGMDVRIILLLISKKRAREMKTQALSVCLHHRNVYTQIINYKVGVFYSEDRTVLKMGRSASVPFESRSFVSDKHCCCQDQGLNGKLALRETR